MFPLECEKKAGVLPAKLAVPGPAMKLVMNEFCPTLPMESAPAFRFSHLFDRRSAAVEGGFRVFVPLPILLDETRHILNLLSASLGLINEEITFHVLQHPTTQPSAIEKYFGVSSRLLLTREPLSDNFAKAKLVISSASSACVEALALGIPVIVVSSEAGLTFDPVAESMGGDMHLRVSTGAELCAAIQQFHVHYPKDAARYQSRGQEILQSYFTPVDARTVAEFLHSD